MAATTRKLEAGGDACVRCPLLLHNVCPWLQANMAPCSDDEEREGKILRYDTKEGTDFLHAAEQHDCPSPDCEECHADHRDESGAPFCSRCKGYHDRHEDAACGCGCGCEPLGCATCDLFCGSSEPYDPYDDPYREDDDCGDGEGCDYCDSDKCGFCPSGEEDQWRHCPARAPLDQDRVAYQCLVYWLTERVGVRNHWHAENMIWNWRNNVADACRIACSGCDYEWMRERIDKGGAR